MITDLSLELVLKHGNPHCQSSRLLNATAERSFEVQEVTVKTSLVGEVC